MLLVNNYNSLPQQVEENRRKIKELEEKGELKAKTFVINSDDWSRTGMMWKCDKNIADMNENSVNFVALNDDNPSLFTKIAFLSINQCSSYDGELRLFCWSTKPAIDIPIIVYYN